MTPPRFSSPFGPPPDPPPLETYECGDLVSHDKYGLGRVTKVTDGVSVVVKFGAEYRHIPAPFTKLVKL